MACGILPDKAQAKRPQVGHGRQAAEALYIRVSVVKTLA